MSRVRLSRLDVGIRSFGCRAEFWNWRKRDIDHGCEMDTALGNANYLEGQAVHSGVYGIESIGDSLVGATKGFFGQRVFWVLRLRFRDKVDE